MFAYGEDGITLWALQNKLDQILLLLGDSTIKEDCMVLYQPSFGSGITGIGKFDFILLTEQKLFLGESKWINSRNRSKNEFPLDQSQLKRHKAFKIYMNVWLENQTRSWTELKSILKPLLQEIDIFIIPDEGTKLQENLLSVLRIIKTHFGNNYYDIEDVLLFFKEEGYSKKTPSKSKDGFDLIIMDYPKSSYNHFIEL